MRFVLLLAALAYLTSAEVTIEDAEEQGNAIPEESKPKAKAQKPKLTPEQLKEKRLKKKQRDRRIESCFVLTRAYYVANADTYTNYIKAHKATQEPEEGNKQIAESNKNRIIQAINADQLINCEKNINNE